MWKRISLGAACATLVLAVVYRRRPKKTLVVVVEAPLADIKFYSDLSSLELRSFDVSIRSAVGKQDSVVTLYLEVDESLLELARIPLPDCRVYRSLPLVVPRLLTLHCVSIDSVNIAKVTNEVHEACFASIMSVPRSVCVSQANHSVPNEVLFVTNPRVVAECFLCDVVGVKHDPLITPYRVVDEIVNKGVLHHGGDWDKFVESISSQFGVELLSAHSQDDLAESLLSSKHIFSSAMLTAMGANKLEMVFGVSAIHFPFLNCAAESVIFVTELYNAATAAFGRWTYENFVGYMHAVFGHDRPEVVRHVPRIFRTLNKSRTGEISFDELCGWIARKLSTRSNRHPEQHLVATVMSLRLPYVFFIDKKHLWPKLECTLRSLSDDDCHV